MVKRHSLGSRLVCTLAFGFVCAAAVPARAQRADGPYAGIFDGSQNDSQQERTQTQAQTLDLRGSTFSALDDNVLPPAGAAADQFRQDGLSGGANAGLYYDVRGNQTHFQVNGGGSFQRYMASQSFSAMAYSTDSSLTTHFTPRLVLEATGALGYSPFYQFAPFLTAAAPSPSLVAPGYGLASVAQRNRTYDSGATLTENFSKRSSISIGGSWHNVQFLDSPSNDLLVWGGRATFIHHISRPLAFHLGYGRDEGRYSVASAERVINEALDIGVDYGDSLPFSRRTSLTFAVGTGAVRQATNTRYRVNGNATLTRGLARSWSASLSYVRRTEFVTGFAQPLFTDSVVTGLDGLLGRRVRWTLSGGYSRGEIGFAEAASASNNFGTYTGTTRLEAALNRRVALYGQYNYYYYNVSAASTLAELLPKFSRQTVTAGLTLWVPFINQVRSSGDSR
jgi:hypothetical protein